MIFLSYSQQFYFFDQTTLKLVGTQAQKVYPLSVVYKVTNYRGVARTYPTNFNLIVKNPCVDKEYVQIVAPVYSQLQYIVEDG